ncbi:MAG TPA: hypothetical protein VM901_08320 [Bdellovibrionota bacterium]|jgi:hypothetical protein|nr:hypothetical protein [Bdellovibrionota bacterium]
MSTTTTTTKKTTAPKTLRAGKKKVAPKAQAKTAQSAHVLSERWQSQMKKYQKNLESLVGDLKKLDKDSAKKMIEQAKSIGEHEWKKVRKNVEAPMEHFLHDLHDAKQTLIRDSEEMVKQMRARLKLLRKQIGKTLHKSASAAKEV